VSEQIDAWPDIHFAPQNDQAIDSGVDSVITRPIITMSVLRRHSGIGRHCAAALIVRASQQQQQQKRESIT